MKNHQNYPKLSETGLLDPKDTKIFFAKFRERVVAKFLSFVQLQYRYSITTGVQISISKYAEQILSLLTQLT